MAEANWKIIEVNNLKVNYKIVGSGEETIVMLQGWGTSCTIYDSISDILSGSFRFIQLDLPGFGLSDEPSKAWDGNDYANFIVDFLNKIDVHNVHLIGHSFGGRISIKLASRKNSNLFINKILLVDSAGIVPKKNIRQKIKIYKYKILKHVFSNVIVYKLFQDLIEYWKTKQGSEDYKNASPIMRQTLVKSVNEDLRMTLTKISNEVLLIWGDNDEATPVSDGKIMNEQFPNSELVVIKNAGHYSFLDQPFMFSEVVKSFFLIGEHNAC